MDVAMAQDRARQERQARLLKAQHAREEPSRAERQETTRQQREALQQAQAARRANLDLKRQQLAGRHGEERKALADLHNARSAAVVQERAAKQPKGVMAFLARVTGFNALTAIRHAREDRRRTAEQRLQTAALISRHRREMQNFRHQDSALVSLDKRERRSLETGLRREALRQIARQGRPTIQPEFTAAAEGKTQTRKGDDERKQKLKKDFAAEARGGESKGLKAAAAFNRKAAGSGPTKGDLQRAFEHAKELKPKPSSSSGQQEHTEEVEPGKPKQARKAREDLPRRKPPPPGPERDREK